MKASKTIEEDNKESKRIMEKNKERENERINYSVEERE